MFLVEGNTDVFPQYYLVSQFIFCISF